jgi:hypothetical protein
MGASIPALIDPRLGRATLAEWYDRWWPTVNNLRPFVLLGATAGFGSARCSRCDGVESISIGNESMSRKRSSTSTVTRPSVHPLWIAEGTHPKQVAVVAGHTSVSVVLDRYGHLYPHQDDSLVEALERRLTQARDLRIAG